MATRILWQAAGSPIGNGSSVGVCRVCGSNGTGQPFDSWVRPTFTDWDKLVPGTILCHSCQFCFAEASELLAGLVGKEKPQRMRNYSHFVVNGKWEPLSKGNKGRMREILLAGIPGVAVVAESGQKHIIFRAVPGVVQFEETQIRDLSPFTGILAVVEELYNGGISKGEIGTGRYTGHRILKFGFERWRELDSYLSPLRQGRVFALALFLAQKEEE